MNNIVYVNKTFSKIVTFTHILINNPLLFNINDAQNKYGDLIFDIITTLDNNLAYKQDYIQSLLLPYIAWIDETILQSNVQFKKEWLVRLLQKKYFNTTNLGEIFFQNYSTFDNDSIELKLTYLYCLVLGFKGKFLSRQDKVTQMLNEDLNKYSYYLNESSVVFVHPQPEINKPKKKFFYFNLIYFASLAFFYIISLTIMYVSLNSKENSLDSNYKTIK